MKVYDTSFLMVAKILKKKKSKFRAKMIFAVTKIMLKFLQNIDCIGEYLTDFNKQGIQWKLMVPATYLMQLENNLKK